MDATPIAARLIQKAQERGTVLSAQLGSVIAREFPSLRTDPEYPGLRSFVEKYCGGRIAIAGEHGGDIVYKFSSEGAPALPLETTKGQISPWDAFQRPNVADRLFVNRSNGELRTSSEDVSDSEFVEISPLTQEEHKAIATAFLPSLQASDSEQANSVLASANYWPGWSKIVNKITYRGAWASLRFEKIKELFRSRLTSLGLREEVISISIQQLLSEKADKRRRHDSTSNRSAQHLAAVGQSRSGRSLRQLVHEIIDSMSDHELRALRLPLGEVLDALEIDPHR